MLARTVFVNLLAAMISLAAGTGNLRAQEKFEVEGRGCVAVPIGDLADLQDVGGSVGIGFSSWFSPRIAVQAGGALEILTGVDSDQSGPAAPDMNLWHYNGGIALRLIDPASASRRTVNINLGAGATTFDSDDFQLSGQTTSFSETYFTANGGVKVGYEVAQNLNSFAGGQTYLMFADDADTGIFGQLRSEIPITAGLSYFFGQLRSHVDPEGFDTLWSIPITVGFSYRLP